MKSLFVTTLFVACCGLSNVYSQSVFVPENGKYIFSLSDVSRNFVQNEIDYISLRPSVNHNIKYKWDKRRNEFQIKNWFRQDWYRLQDMFTFKISDYVTREKGADFNEAKRNQYSKFRFDKKKFFHWKSTPAMKEWGGLTHPPIKTLSLPLQKYDRNFAPKNYRKIVSPYFSPQLQKDIDHLSKSELTFKNEVSPLADRHSFSKKMALISKAKDSILMSSLVFVCDTSTRNLVNLLIRKHREGIDVKIIADGFIGKLLGHRECLQTMSRAGIDVMETKDFFKHRLNAIYHTKTLIVDLKEAVAGGHNMLDADNTSRGVDFKNRDIDLYIKGAMVTDIAKQFVENWRYQTTLNRNFSPLHHIEVEIKSKLASERKAGTRGKELYARILGNISSRMDGVCRFIKQAPYEDRHTIGKAYLKLLGHLKRHLVITDPIKVDTHVANIFDAPLAEKFDSFEMFNQLHNKVQMLAKSGKLVDYITTNINMAGNENVAMMNEQIREQLENGKEWLANWSLAKLLLSNSYYGKPHYTNLLNDWVPLRNVRVWNHISFMHSKIFYFDRIVASVGSYNFQHNATDHAYESTVICMDENLNQKLDKILVEDMANSIPLIYSSLR